MLRGDMGESGAMPLEQELKTYAAHREELLGRAKGKFVLIKGDQVIDDFASQEDALKRGYEEFGNQPFLVKQVEEIETPLDFASFHVAF